jgi:menaquinone-dependent protoporphyrinogen IX oxidase
MKVIIICNSKTGFTRQYSDWIAEDVEGAMIPYKEFFGKPDRIKNIEADDIVLFGSRLHAGRIEYLDKVKTHFARHPHFIVFAVGATPVKSPEAIEKLWADNLTEDEKNRIPHFYMQGGLNYEKMSIIDRTLMKTVAKIMAKKANQPEEGTDVADNIAESFDASSREYIKPLTDFIRALQNDAKETLNK